MWGVLGHWGGVAGDYRGRSFSWWELGPLRRDGREGPSRSGQRHDPESLHPGLRSRPRGSLHSHRNRAADYSGRSDRGAWLACCFASHRRKVGTLPTSSGHCEISRFEDGYASATRRLVALVFHCVSTFSKNCSARGSLDCPSQNIACFRTAGFRLFCATSISFGTPSSFGSWLRAKTAFFFTSVSGSFSIAPVIVPTAFFPAFCASQKSACPRTCELLSSCAMRIISSSAPASWLTESAKAT